MQILDSVFLLLGEGYIYERYVRTLLGLGGEGGLMMIFGEGGSAIQIQIPTHLVRCLSFES